MKKALIPLTLVLILLLSGIAFSEGLGGIFNMDWFTIDGGGGTSSSGSYTVVGSVGQPDAGALSGSGYTLSGGFWSGPATAGPVEYRIYLPMANRQ